MSRVGTALRGGVTTLRRTPVLVGLLAVAPAYVVGVFTLVAPAGRATVYVNGETVRTTLDAAFPAITTPMTAALVTGITGLFLMHTAANADARLVLAGYRAYQVVLARLGVVVVVSAVATAVSVGVMRTAFTPERLAWFMIGTLLTALVYGMIGVLVGLVLDRLPGVYLVLFGAMIDLFVFQNPLATDSPAVAVLLPGHYPLRVATAAAFAERVPLEPLGWTVAVLVVVTGLATAVFVRRMQLS